MEDLTHWEPFCAACETLKTVLTRALGDWGTRLDPLAYRDVVTHFLGGELTVVKEIEVRSEHGVLGRQKMRLLSEDIAFSITSAIHRPAAVLEHRRRFLQHTNLRAIQWINLDGQKATFHTLQRK
jgi:hypothetical protein